MITVKNFVHQAKKMISWKAEPVITYFVLLNVIFVYSTVYADMLPLLVTLPTNGCSFISGANLDAFWSRRPGTVYSLNNLFAEHHFRYRKTGGIAYHHISDKYVALFSTFIACGVWEAVEIIDALLKMDEEDRPDKIHADTQRQSTLVFAISYLLGINLMPRIRNWKKITLYKPSSKIKYENIDGLFSGKSINWKLIEEGWDEIMNIILAIHKGEITSSMILHKLNSKSKNNNLYKALQELGRVIRTLFLLEYISNLDLRQQITATTNKAESYNGISKWLRFGNEHAIVASNDSAEQEKAVKYNTLLVNAVVLQNLIDMSQIIQELIKKGIEIKLQDLMYLRPYKYAHIKRFGEYFLQLLQKPMAISNYMNSSMKLCV